MNEEVDEENSEEVDDEEEEVYQVPQSKGLFITGQIMYILALLSFVVGAAVLLSSYGTVHDVMGGGATDLPTMMVQLVRVLGAIGDAFFWWLLTTSIGLICMVIGHICHRAQR
jgi:hypothetical protein